MQLSGKGAETLIGWGWAEWRWVLRLTAALTGNPQGSSWTLFDLSCPPCSHPPRATLAEVPSCALAYWACPEPGPCPLSVLCALRPCGGICPSCPFPTSWLFPVLFPQLGFSPPTLHLPNSCASVRSQLTNPPPSAHVHRVLGDVNQLSPWSEAALICHCCHRGQFEAINMHRC